jgi:starch-binding outer membrane protein, SusD/RagB family
MKRNNIVTLLALVITVMSCTDLDVSPKSSATANVIFNNPSAYEQFLARIYAGLAISGQQGPAGNPDIKGIDEGFSNYLRQYWKAQQLTTDETVIGWNDGTLPTYHLHTWTAQNEFINAMFNRIYFQISMANEFLRETTDEKLDSRNTTDQLRAAVQQYRAEARALRALSYWHGLDMFGAIPIVTEANEVGISVPDQSTKQEVFDFIESELKAIENELATAGQIEYGRVDQGMAWMVLAKLYLNAEVYTGQPKYTECISYCSKIIDAGYQLDANYNSLFMLENVSSPEIIFAVNFDGNRTQTYGGMTFLIHASIGGSMNPGDYGVNTGWAGLRATKNLVNLFPDETGDTDGRAIFYTNGQSKEIPNTPISAFSEGYAVPKFRNLNVDGDPGSSLEFVDTDFPMFRLADVYLMYAEAVERGGTGGSEANAVSYINLLRNRAYGDDSGNITDAQLTLDFLIDERARELYWEAHRRTDLIRFGLFSDSEEANPRAVWPWKGGVAEGKETEGFRDVFPLPSSQIIANPKLVQNEGY